MIHFRIFILFVLMFINVHSAFALEDADRNSILTVIQNYTNSWNLNECKGFANGFTEDADFVNIYGMVFSGKEEIEARHIKILQTFLKGSMLYILDTRLREVQPGLVIALVHWRLDGYRNPGSDISKAGETREGIYTQVFIKSEKDWEITSSQNTLIPN